MSTEENYLDNLLKAVMEPKTTESMEGVKVDVRIEDVNESDTVTLIEEPIAEDCLIMEELPELSDSFTSESVSTMENAPQVLEEVSTAEDGSLISEEILPSEDDPLISEEVSAAEDGSLISEEVSTAEDGSLISEEILPSEDDPLISEEVLTAEDGSLISEEILPSEDDPLISEEILTAESEAMGEEAVVEETLTTEEFPKMEELLTSEELPALEEVNMDELSDLEELQSENELNFDDLEVMEIPDVELSDIDTEQKIETGLEELGIEELGIGDLEVPDIPEGEADLGIEEPEIEDLGIEELGIGDLEIPDIPEEETELQSELSIDGLDAAIQSETELEMAGELNIDELDLDSIASEPEKIPEISDLSDDLGIIDDTDIKDELLIDEDDNLDDVLSMLDDDAELAEINDMLKKSDNNEPIQDDMMDLLNQMADDEAASVNAGIKHVDEDDGGIPLPEIPNLSSETEKTRAGLGSDTGNDTKKKGKKASQKKKNAAVDTETTSTKELGKLGKFFNMLTEDLVPEPTEEELAAEKEAKEAKKQENLTKKEQDKLAKEEAKKAKTEEKEAAKKAKAEIATQKKKEKQAAKEKKAAAKRAKQDAEGPKNAKRIPPKKIAVAVVFGATVGGAVIVSTNVLATQGFLQSARNAYYEQDYKTVYQATYGMELDESKSDGLIQARSEVILKLQRRYDSYQTNLKMGREVEALDALLQGVATYDYINAEAEKYGVMAEVDAIRTNILSILEAKYGLDEAAARELINNDDALSYTIALNDIISGI